tara:strand:- start:446 stop:703 length:258 start_codon:yes stop_codon:yes gene_type:complete
MKSPFKMKGFGGFGNSPLRQEKHFLEKEKTIPQVDAKTARESAKADSVEAERIKALGMEHGAKESQHSIDTAKKYKQLGTKYGAA